MGRRRRKHTLAAYNNSAKLRRNRETPEERELRLKKNRIRAAERRSSETLENRAIRLALARERINAKRNHLKRKAKSADVTKILEKIKSANIKSGEVSSLVDNLDKKQRNAYEAYMQLKTERETSAKRAAARRRQETPEQRAYRLEQGRMRVAMVRANESVEERADRLARLRINLKKHRDVKKLQNAQTSKSFDAYTNYLIAVTQSLDNINARKITTSKCDQYDLAIPEQDRLKPAHVAHLYQFCRAYKAYQSGSLYLEQQKSKKKKLPQPFNPYMTSGTADNPTIDVTPVECEVMIEEGSDLEDVIPLIEEDVPQMSVSYDHLEIKNHTSEVTRDVHQ